MLNIFGKRKKDTEINGINGLLSHITNQIVGLARHLNIEPKDFVNLIHDKDKNLEYCYEIARIDAINRGDVKELEFLSQIKEFSKILESKKEVKI